MGRIPKGALDHERHRHRWCPGHPGQVGVIGGEARQGASPAVEGANELPATLARNNQRPAEPPTPDPRVVLVCCVDCINQGCDQTMIGQVGLTRAAAQCDCRVHHLRN